MQVTDCGRDASEIHPRPAGHMSDSPANWKVLKQRLIELNQALCEETQAQIP
jgi:hypothetical protein